MAPMAGTYNYFRDYDASLGRYVESDPIGLKGGSNTFAYVKAAPLTRHDRRGLFIALSCSAGQRRQIDEAEQAILKKLEGSCGSCGTNGGNGQGCVPCGYSERIRRAVKTSTVTCPTEDSPDCGNALVDGTSINIFKLGFGSPQSCGALKATLLHEAMHNAGLGDDQHRFINDIELKCFGNEAVDRYRSPQ